MKDIYLLEKNGWFQRVKVEEIVVAQEGAQVSHDTGDWAVCEVGKAGPMCCVIERRGTEAISFCPHRWAVVWRP